MFKITLTADTNEALIWAHLADGDPRKQSESFVIGEGATPYAACVNALASLKDAEQQIGRLQLEPPRADNRTQEAKR